MTERRVVAYSDEQRRLAMLIWGFKANRNASETARLLATAEYADVGLDGVSRQTIANWARDENWDQVIGMELFAEAPSLRFKTQAELILAAPEAARLLRDVVTLDESLKTETWITTYETVEGKRTLVHKPVRMFDEKLIKLRVQAAQLTLDRTGFSPVGTRDVGQLDAPPAADEFDPESVDWSDPVQARQYERWVYQQAGLNRRAVESGKQRKAGS
jgi:hypothetical protein